MLVQYPDLFLEKDITMNKFKYVYILTINRAFSSPWPGVSLMVPYADFLNHENVDLGFSCVDAEGVAFPDLRDPEEKKSPEELE